MDSQIAAHRMKYDIFPILFYKIKEDPSYPVEPGTQERQGSGIPQAYVAKYGPEPDQFAAQAYDAMCIYAPGC